MPGRNNVFAGAEDLRRELTDTMVRDDLEALNTEADLEKTRTRAIERIQAEAARSNRQREAEEKRMAALSGLGGGRQLPRPTGAMQRHFPIRGPRVAPAQQVPMFAEDALANVASPGQSIEDLLARAYQR